LIIFLKPRKELLPLALSATAWAFFLFSFQVHEKSVLLPLMPMTVLLAGKNGLGRYERAWVGFANLLGVWTLFPLLQRVDLRIPYYVLSLLWAYLLGLPPTSLEVYKEMRSSYLGIATILLHIVFYTAMAAWHFFEALMLPPRKLPDLWVVANVGIGAVGFGICYLWCLAQLLTESGLFARKRERRTGEKGRAKVL
jgi:alpha-1,3-glucosyltransferase